MPSPLTKDMKHPLNPTVLKRIFSYLIRPIYSVERKTSADQLREDFGEFPPAPLTCKKLSGDIHIIRVRGLGEAYQDMLLIRSVVDTLETDGEEALSTDLKSQLDATSFLALRAQLRSLVGNSRKLEASILSLAFFVLFIRLSVRDLVKGRRRKTVMGLFVPIFKNESRIIIRTARHSARSDSPTISHEHIHALQHKSLEQHRRGLASPESVISDEWKIDRFIHYIFERDEVEARLHELVLSFYRVHGQLPTSVPAFFGLLAASENIGGLIEDAFTRGNIDFLKDLKAYPAREEEWVKQFALILIAIREPDLQLRFICEVLPVMYGNLLSYYGEDPVEYRAALSRPNLYDELYGVPAC